VDQATGQNISLETQLSQMQRQLRQLEHVNSSLPKFKRENEDLALQNDRLQTKLIEAKMRIDSL